MAKPNRAPVSVVEPDEAKKPPWLDPAVEAALGNPRHQDGGLWTDGVRDGTEALTPDAGLLVKPGRKGGGVLAPSQFGVVWVRTSLSLCPRF